MNTSLFYTLYNFAHQSVSFDTTIIFFAEYFPYVVIILAGAFLLFHHDILKFQNPLRALARKWREIIIVFFSGIVGWGLASILKLVIHTPRPFVALSDVYALIPETGFAFPSGHATFFMALAVGIFMSHRKTGIFFIIAAILIGIARIMAGVHFPIDILGGFILGGACATGIANALAKRASNL